MPLKKKKNLSIIFPLLLGLILLLYMAIAYFGERFALKEHEVNFNKQQQLQTLFAANGIQQNFNQIKEIDQALIKNIKSIIEIYPNPDKTLANFIRNTVDSHVEIMGIALYYGDDLKKIRWFDDNQVARSISEEWRQQYGRNMRREFSFFVPPIYIQPEMQYFGIIMNDSSTLGMIQIVTVVDLAPWVERFVVPMRSGQHGAGYILDGLGNIVFDHETEIIGRNVFDGMHDKYEELSAIDKRLISESFGTGKYSFTVERGGSVKRKLIAWQSANFGDQRLVVAASAPIKEVNLDLSRLRIQLYILAALFILSILAGTLIYFRYINRKTKQTRVQFLNVVMDAIPDMFYYKDRDRRFLGCNSAFAEFIRHPQDEVVGKGFYELFPDFRNLYYDKFEEEVLEKGVVKRFEERNVDFHPSISALDTILTPLFDAEGNVEGVVGVSRDITEKYKIQQQLQRSDQRYNLTQQAVGIANWDWDLKSDTVVFSKEAFNLLKFSAFKLTWTIADIRKIIYADDLDLFDNNYEACKNGADEFQYDIRFIIDDGAHWFSLQGRRIADETDGDQRFLGIIQDVSARKRSELELKQLALAIDHADEIILVADPAGRLTYANPAFEKITGYPQEEVLGKPLSFLKSDKHSENYHIEVDSMLKHGRVWRGTFINKRKDGTLFEVESTISPIRDDNGQVISFVGVLKDVTLEHELKQRLIHTQKMEAIGTLAGGIAHDFNNILSAVIGYGELAILDVPQDNPSYRGIQEIVKAGYRAKDVIQQILTFSRRSDSERKPVQLKTIVDETYSMLKTTLPANIEVYIDIQTDGLVYADPSRLHQILMNLCTNAYQAMKPDGGELTIRLSETETRKIPSQLRHSLKQGHYNKLSVIDTGCGMPQEVIKRIFEPYYTTKGQDGGTGLGLSTVHGIIMDYMGAIDVQSKPNAGTIIDVYLPMLTKNALMKNPKQQVYHLSEVFRIIFVDDDPNVASMIKIGLNRTGHQVHTFTDPVNALNYFRNDPGQFDMIVSDISMPKISGLDLLLEVRNTRPNIPVILCTGHDSFADLDAAYRTGADLIIMKPITWQILIEKINEVMQQRRI